MVKKVTSGKDPHRMIKGKVETLSEKTHMEIFRALAKITQMHGTPGDRKKKKGGK